MNVYILKAFKLKQTREYNKITITINILQLL